VSVRHESGIAPGAMDFELGSSRERFVAYHLSIPSADARGLVFLIPHFGDDPKDPELLALADYLAESHAMICVIVEYHCLRSRISDGARFEISGKELDSLRSICREHHVALIDSNAVIAAIKQLPKPYEFAFRVIPGDGSYQDLGLIQALDHLAVLHHLSTTGLAWNYANVIAAGAGYGGYLAQLMAKFAPNTFNTVLDLAGPLRGPRSWLFGGSFPEPPPYYYHAGQSRIFPLIESRWSLDPSSPRHFSRSAEKIRSTTDAAHLSAMRGLAANATNYRLGWIDGDATAAEKAAQADQLRQNGFDALGGPVSSGEERSSVSLLRKFLIPVMGKLPNKPPTTDSSLGTSVAYYCSDAIYSFEHGSWGCTASVTTLGRAQIPIYRQV
jgi:hypothetical protein